ncbi:MAG: hypothetical protein IJE81_07060 [Oscillospiraceae bacterium]|nr:hypothetical protein [Oscillospiraceae bacterium]
MKKNIFSIMLLIVMIAALMVSATGCGKNEEAADEAALRIAELEQQNADLQKQIEALTAELNGMKQRAALQNWNLTADAWNDGNGATVTFTATPINYVEGQRAALSIRMGDLEAESTNCVWDGSSFVGSVELSAADGYSYYCILTNLDGSQEEIVLNSPENTTNETLVYLGSNLTTYANMVVEDWSSANGKLVIGSGYIQAQMPRLSAGGTAPSVTRTELVLHLNGEEVDRQEVVLTAGEGKNSYETTVSNLSFSVPAMEDEHQLDLWLEITLSNGNIVSASGGSWYSNSGELQLVVG